MRKILFTLSLVVLLCALAVVGVSATTDYSDQVIAYLNFKESATGVYNEAGTNVVTYDTDEEVARVEVTGTYASGRIGFDLPTDKAASTTVYIRVTYAAESAFGAGIQAPAGSANSGTFTAENTNGQFKQFVAPITYVPSHANNYVRFQFTGTGTLYIEDIGLFTTEEAAKNYKPGKAAYFYDLSTANGVAAATTAVYGTSSISYDPAVGAAVFAIDTTEDVASNSTRIRLACGNFTGTRYFRVTYMVPSTIGGQTAKNPKMRHLAALGNSGVKVVKDAALTQDEWVTEVFKISPTATVDSLHFVLWENLNAGDKFAMYIKDYGLFTDEATAYAYTSTGAEADPVVAGATLGVQYRPAQAGVTEAIRFGYTTEDFGTWSSQVTNISYGVLLTSEATYAANGNNLDFNYVNGTTVIDVPASVLYTDTADTKAWTAAVHTIPEEQVNTNLVAVGYIKYKVNGVQVVKYLPAIIRSLATARASVL